jgi:Na+/melibiose symporter-like transporter
VVQDAEKSSETLPIQDAPQPTTNEDVRMKELSTSTLASQPDVEANDIAHSARWNDRRILIAFWLYMFLNFSLRGIMGVVETYGAVTHQELYGLGQEDAVEDSGIYFVIMGTFGILTFLALSRLVKYFGDAQVLLFGIASIVCGSILFLPPVMSSSAVRFSVGVVFMCVPVADSFNVRAAGASEVPSVKR